MYKTAVITDEISQDIVVAAGLARHYRLDGIEIRSVAEKNPFQMSNQDFRYIKDVADDFGLSICAISSPFFKCDRRDKQEIAAHYEGLQRCCDAAHLFGCTMIRGFTFWDDGRGSDSFDAITQLYQHVIQIARDNGIVMIIESEPSVCTRNTTLLAEFIERVASPQIAAVWDPGNEIAIPDAVRPYPEGYERLKPYIRHIHLKDIKRTPNGSEPALLGEGDVDYHGALQRLVQDGYSGYVSIETHYRMKLCLDESTMIRPQGSAFSEGGLEATSAYLEILHDRYGWSERQG